MIKNYIFDFGNVIAEFIPQKLTAPYIKDQQLLKTVCDVVFDLKYWDKLDSNSITEFEVKNDFALRLPEDLCEIACQVFDGWIENLTPIKGMCELISDLKKQNKKLYLLSNISVRFANDYVNTEWIKNVFSLFDGLVFSATTEFVKPDKDMFEYVLNKFNLKPEECLFIDDASRNIAGAKQAGIEGYLFDGDSEKLREFLSATI
jgi:putative hydrolase of the HAD superfamily